MFKRFTDSFRSSTHRTRRRQSRPPVLNLESLEDRRMLAMFTVTNTDDGQVAAAGDLPGSLRQAIFDANTNPGDDTVEFDSSVFTGGNASVVRLTAGQLNVEQTLTIDGSTGIEITITGDANDDDITDSLNITDVDASFGGTRGAADDLLDDNSRVLNFSATTGDLNLKGLIISGGRAFFNGGGGVYASTGNVTLIDSAVSGNSATLARGRGGGIRANSGAVSLTNSTVTGNRSDDGGGGVHTSFGAVTLNSSEISDNRTSPRFPGGFGFHGGGIFTSFGDVTLNDSTVSRNSAYDHGGGIRSASGTVTLNNSSVFGNSASDGGGIKTSSGNLTLNDSTVRENSAAGFSGIGGGINTTTGQIVLTNSSVIGNTTVGNFGFGGGIYASPFAGAVTLINSTVSGNLASGSGGGIYGAATLIDSTVSGNSTSGVSGVGGGIHTGNGAAIIINSTVSQNYASRSGGGLHSSSGAVTLNNSTIVGNESVGGGGGVHVNNSSEDPSLTIQNSIVAGNTDDGAASDLRPDPDSTVTIKHSLIGVADGLTIAGNAGNWTGTAASPLDPMLGPLADNGGPTQTHALLLGSAAIDAGSNALAVDQNGWPLVKDQRGFRRILDRNNDGTATADIGAFELGGIAPLHFPVVDSVSHDEGGDLARPDLLGTFAVSFDVDVGVNADDLMIRNDTLGGTVVDSSGVTLEYDAGSRTATWDFSSLTLDPAYYSFELSDDIVSVDGTLSLDGDFDGNPGGTFVESIYVALPGDADLDGHVDVLSDAFHLVSNLGTTGGTTWAQGDFNGDGNVNVLGDAFILVGRLGQSVVPPATALAASVANYASMVTSSDPTFTQPIVFVDAGGNLFDDQDDDLPTDNPLSVALELSLAGSQELDAAFESGNLIDSTVF